MKKLIPILATVLLLTALVFSSEAADVKVADVYSSSILATVDGHPIPSYNIGGYTCICLEDLQYYGFDVIWDPINRIISATSSDKPADYSVFANLERGVTGSIIGSVYESTIVAEVNGRFVPSYNIGGYTCVCIETLGDLTDSPNLDYGYSQYLMRAYWDADNAIIDLSTFRCTPESENPFILAGLEYGCVYRVGDPYGTVRAGEDDAYLDFRGAITQIIPLYYEMYGEMTDIIVGYASPFGVSFHTEGVAAVLENELYLVLDPAALAEKAIYEDCFVMLDYIDAEDCVILYGYYDYAEQVLYTLRLFTSNGQSIELLEDLPGIDAAEREFPLEGLTINEGKTLLTFSLIYDGRLYTYEVDLTTSELDMA